MRFSVFHAVLGVVSLGLSFWINGTCAARLAESHDAAYSGDRKAGEDWIDRTADDLDCRFVEALGFLESAQSRLITEPEFVKRSVKRFYAEGATKAEFCEQTIEANKYVSHVLVTLPDDPGAQDDVISEVQSFLRREATVYGGVAASDRDEVKEYVRYGALVGDERVLIEMATVLEPAGGS